MRAIQRCRQAPVIDFQCEPMCCSMFQSPGERKTHRPSHLRKVIASGHRWCRYCRLTGDGVLCREEFAGHRAAGLLGAEIQARPGPCDHTGTDRPQIRAMKGSERNRRWSLALVGVGE